MNGGRLILIHGASSAGKSTLAAAVQGGAPEPFVRLSFDQLIDSGALPRGEGWRVVRERVFDGFHRAVAAYLAAGVDVIWDHIIETAEWQADLRRLLAGADLFCVGLHVPLERLKAREAARGDRGTGGAEADFHSVHKGMAYDLELDGMVPAEENAVLLLTAWAARRGLSAFLRGPG